MAKTLFVHSPLEHDGVQFNVGDAIELDAETASGLLERGIVGTSDPLDIAASSDDLLEAAELKIADLERKLAQGNKAELVTKLEAAELKIADLERKLAQATAKPPTT